MTTTRAPAIGVLLVEDDEDDYFVTRDMLERQERVRFLIEWCSDYDAALAAITEQRHDVYLIDYRLGAHTGLDLVRDGFANRGRAAVIMLTGQSDYEVDLEATSLGVTDFLLKQELNPQSLERSIRYAISHERMLADLARSEERYALAARAVNDGIWDWDLQNDVVYYSPRWHVLLGRPEPDSSDRAADPATWLDQVHEEDRPGLRVAIEAHLSGRTSLLQSKHRVRHADGSWRWVLARGMAMHDPHGRPIRMVGSLSDITERRRNERQLEHDALHDLLTGLPNRALFMDRLERATIRTTRDPEAGCAVLFLDIDRFKLVNDTFSHPVGDQLLVALAERISRALRPGDTIARISGDEFTILLDDIEAHAADKTATVVAGRVQAALRESFEIDGHHLFVTGSIGIALAAPGSGAADILRNADIAMYEAKRRGRDSSAVFDESMHSRIADRLARENDLREVIERNLIDVSYQPVVELATGRIRGFEALARWPHGWPAMSPAEFIPIAEETGLIPALGVKVLNEALMTLAGWRRAGLVGDDVRMSVNVSGRQLDEASFPDEVLKALADAGLPGDALRLEITEGVLMREPERMARMAAEVCSSGVGLELDDFGTGYSSLAALHQFPVSALKIDRSFVADLTSSEDGDVIVRSTVALAHSLGLEVVAEGIENADQLTALQALGCEFGQGFYFSEPRSTQQLDSILREWEPKTRMASAV